MKIVTATADAQRYIASKHTQPDVKKWTTIEQCNYYFAIFEGKGPFRIAAEVLVKDVKKVADKIRQCILFKKQNTKPYKNERKLLHHFKGLMNIFLLLSPFAS